MNEVQLIAKLSDLSEEHYHQLVMLSAMMELLIDKGILTRQEIETKMIELDTIIGLPPYPMV